MKKALLFILVSLSFSFSTLAQSAEEYFQRGNTKYLAQDFTGALSDYTTSISLKPNQAQTYYNRAHAQESLKNYAAALEDYSYAINLDPKYAEAFVERGLLKFNKK
jgi:tetratricopeptide (TPR) repeat protein